MITTSGINYQYSWIAGMIVIIKKDWQFILLTMCTGIQPIFMAILSRVLSIQLIKTY